MEGFHLAGIAIDRLKHQREEERALRPADAWPTEERTPERRSARLAASRTDFWEFDRTYWPPELYSQGYADPSAFHAEIVRHAQARGVQIVLGPRDHGKTVTAKKLFVWRLLTGRIRIGGTYSHTLPTAQNILGDVLDLIRDNPRIVDDYGVNVVKGNDEQFAIRTSTFRHTARVEAYSEGKSVRGYARGFDRPEFFLADDVETRQSPRSSTQAEERIRRWSEVSKSMASGGTLLILGNDFDEQTAMHRLRTEQDQGIIAAGWQVHVYPAWTHGAPLWPQRFPVTTEAELRLMIAPLDDAEWSGDYMQNPRAVDSEFFPRAQYQEYASIPEDARGVIYVDPNLAKRGKGDACGMTALLYSRSTQKYYVYRLRLRSYSGSNELLNDCLDMRDDRIFAVGFDGHVTQESTWTNNVRNWCSVHNAPFPRIDYKRYRVDDLAKNASAAWRDGLILFPTGTGLTIEGREYLAQCFAFSGKKANHKDDAPDSLICAFELLHDRGYVRRPLRDSSQAHTISVTDIYSF